MISTNPPFDEIWRSTACVNNLSMSGRIAVSPDKRKLAVPGERSVEIRDFNNGIMIDTLDLPRPDDRFFGFNLLWTSDNRWIAEMSSDWVNIWDAHSGRHVFQLILRTWLSDPSIDRIAVPTGYSPACDVFFDKPSGRIGVATHSQLRIFEPGDWSEAIAHPWPLSSVTILALAENGVMAVGADCGVALIELPWIIDRGR